jgi:hypothetical protein
MSLGRALPLLLVLAPLALPAGAGASDFQRIFGDYRTDGRLDGCYSPGELDSAARQIPPDVAQYTPGFGDALATAGGQCGGGAPAAPAPDEPPAPVSAGTPGPTPAAVTKKTVKEPPAPKEAAPILPDLPQTRFDTAAAAVSADMPGGLIALIVAAAVALAIAAAWMLAWFMGWNAERLTKPLFAAFQTVWDRLLPGR